MQRVGLPAYHRQSATPATPIAMHPLELNRPIGCAGVAVYPGDILVGDEDGVVVIPHYLAAEVAAEAFEGEGYERFVEREIARGRALIGLFSRHAGEPCRLCPMGRAGPARRPVTPTATVETRP